MTQSALDSLWTYLQSLQLSYSNRQWLAEHLVNTAATAVEEDETEYLTSSPAMKKILDEGLKEHSEEDYAKIDLENLWK